MSDWLADKLRAHGAVVVEGYDPLPVWCRGTSGQAIALDSVIRKIRRELDAAREAS